MVGNFAKLDSPRRLAQFWQSVQTSLVILIANCYCTFLRKISILYLLGNLLFLQPLMLDICIRIAAENRQAGYATDYKYNRFVVDDPKRLQF